MKIRALMRAATVTFLTFISSATIAIADDIQRQEHPPGSCANDDGVCLKAWWQEYRSAMLQEFHFWSAFRSDAVAGNRDAAERDIQQAQVSSQYKHYKWDFYRGDAFTGVSNEQLVAVTWGCRDAVISMKYWLIGLGHDDYAQGPADRTAYDKAAKQCMTAESPKVVGRHHLKH